jgi:hypothetical protein
VRTLRGAQAPFRLVAGDLDHAPEAPATGVGASASALLTRRRGGL